MERKKYRKTYIKQWRALLGISQEELAERVGLSPGHISLLETGERGYTQDSLERIAHELRCTPGELLNVDPTRDGSLMSTLEMLRPEDRRDLQEMAQMLLRRRRGEAPASG